MEINTFRTRSKMHHHYLCLLKRHAIKSALKASLKDISALHLQLPVAVIHRQTSFNNALYFKKCSTK